MTENNLSSVELSLDWDGAFGNEACAKNGHADSISDALIMSLSNRGKVDIDYIIDVSGEDYYTVIEALKGAIYQNPDKWEEEETEETTEDVTGEVTEPETQDGTQAEETTAADASTETTN